MKSVSAKKQFAIVVGVLMVAIIFASIFAAPLQMRNEQFLSGGNAGQEQSYKHELQERQQKDLPEIFDSLRKISIVVVAIVCVALLLAVFSALFTKIDSSTNENPVFLCVKMNK